MKEKTELKNELVEGVIWKQLLLYFLPLLLSSYLQQLYNAVDAVIVGKVLGKQALSAVGGASASIINLLFGFFIGLSTGVTVVISQNYGANNEEEVNKAVHTSMALAVVCGLLITIIGVCVADPILKAMNTPKDVLPYSIVFLRVIFMGMIPNMVYNIGAAIMRAIGNSRVPLYFLIASCIINVILVLFFVFVLHLGLLGVGLATVIAQTICAILVLITLLKSTKCYQLRFREIKIHSDVMRMILLIGIPAAIQSVVYAFANLTLQATVNLLGTDTVAAWAAYSKVDVFYWVTVTAFGISVTTFVGQNYGAAQYDRVWRGTKVCMRMALLVAFIMSSILYTNINHILALFTDDTNIIRIGCGIVHFLVPFYFIHAVIEIHSGTLRGIGNSIFPMVVSIFGICILRISWLFFAVPIRPKLTTVLFSYPLTWCVTVSIILLYYYFYKRKMTKLWCLQTHQFNSINTIKCYSGCSNFDVDSEE